MTKRVATKKPKNSYFSLKISIFRAKIDAAENKKHKNETN